MTDTSYKIVRPSLATSTVAAAPSPTTFKGINGDTVSLLSAMPIAQPVNTLRRADASSGFALANCLGLLLVGGDVTMPVCAISSGPLTLSAAAWNAVTGGSGGLIPGARYYLDVLPGRISTTPPTALGQYVTMLGFALSELVLLVKPERPILL